MANLRFCLAGCVFFIGSPEEPFSTIYFQSIKTGRWIF